MNMTAIAFRTRSAGNESDKDDRKSAGEVVPRKCPDTFVAHVPRLAIVKRDLRLHHGMALERLQSVIEALQQEIDAGIVARSTGRQQHLAARGVTEFRIVTRFEFPSDPGRDPFPAPLPQPPVARERKAGMVPVAFRERLERGDGLVSRDFRRRSGQFARHGQKPASKMSSRAKGMTIVPARDRCRSLASGSISAPMAKASAAMRLRTCWVVQGIKRTLRLRSPISSASYSVYFLGEPPRGKARGSVLNFIQTALLTGLLPFLSGLGSADVLARHCRPPDDCFTFPFGSFSQLTPP